MAISREQQSHAAMTGVLVSTPVVVVVMIVLIVTHGETLIGWAEGWPGGPTAFGCVLRNEHADAVTAGWVGFVAVTLVGSGTLARLFRRRTG